MPKALDPTVLDSPGGADEPAPLRAARAFLESADPIAEGLRGALTPEVAELLVEHLVRRGDAVRLEGLAALPDKLLAKQARRGIHLLRARGMKAEIPAQRPAADRPSLEPEVVELHSLVSVAFRDGEFLLWYVRTGGEGLEVYQAQITETEGLQQLEGYRPSRKQWRGLERAIVDETGVAVAQVPSSWARWLLEEANQRSLDAGRTPPREYAEVRHKLEPAERPARHPADDAIPEEAVAAAGPVEAVLLLKETGTWIPDEPLAKRAYEEIAELARSPIVLDERQRNERIDDVIRRVCAEALAGPWRARLVRRFQDTAYFLSRLAGYGPPTRPWMADAALCLAAARHVQHAAPGEDRVAFALFKRLVPVERPAPGDEPPRTSGGGLIIEP